MKRRKVDARCTVCSAESHHNSQGQIILTHKEGCPEGRPSYTATLDGAEIGSGTMQDIQAASAQAITGLLAQDPDGVAMSAMDANRAFQTGAVEKAVQADGQWSAPFWVNGRPEKLIVTRGSES